MKFTRTRPSVKIFRRFTRLADVDNPKPKRREELFSEGKLVVVRKRKAARSVVDYGGLVKAAVREESHLFDDMQIPEDPASIKPKVISL